MKNKWSWMENCREMEQDHYFCGSMSTTRSHTRNHDPPQWSERFVSTAAHFSPVSVAIIIEIDQLKMPEWLLLANAVLDIHSTINSGLPDFFFNLREKKKNNPKKRKKKTRSCE